MQCHTPFEERGEQEVVERLGKVDRVPALVRVDPHDLVAEIFVFAADVGERVVDVVVRVTPGFTGGCGIPVPHRRVDVRIVHPVPLAVHHVVADLHVLEDLGHPEARGACHPGHLRPRPEQQHAAGDGQLTLGGDDVLDVGAVAITEVAVDLVMDRIEFFAQLFDGLVTQMRQRVLWVRSDRTDSFGVDGHGDS